MDRIIFMNYACGASCSNETYLISYELYLSYSQCENEVMGGRIISAVAKMNEYYLNNADFAERRFTSEFILGTTTLHFMALSLSNHVIIFSLSLSVCHEIGQ